MDNIGIQKVIIDNIGIQKKLSDNVAIMWQLIKNVDNVMKIMCLFVVVSCFYLIWIVLVLEMFVANCDWWNGCECL